MADDTTAPAPVPTPSPDVLSQLAPYLALLQQGQAQPTRDMTPVEQDWRSKLGEALGGPVMMPNMTPAERQASGLMALRHFGLGMLGATGHGGTTIGGLLSGAFEGAERGALGAQQFDASTLAAQQEYQQKQQELRISAIKEALPLLSLQQSQQRLGALGNLPSSLGGQTTTTGTNIATGGSIGAAVPRDPSIPTIGQQGNNPGNISAGVPGSTGYITAADGQKVGVFPDLPSGIAAHSDTLSGYAAKGINTVTDAVKAWVGPNADPAVIKGYAADVAKRIGVDPNARVDLTDPTVQRNFILAQQPHESGKAWLKPEDVDKGLAIAAARRGGGTQAATPPAAPAQQTPPAPAPRAPIGTPADALPAGGATVAGPAGAATVGAPKPPGPAVPGDVNAIITGMTGAGANAGTLAPGGAVSAPQAPAQVATTAPVVPAADQTQSPPAAPGGPPAFNYVPRQPPPGTIQGGALTPDEQRVVQDARNSYGVAIRAAALIPDAAKAAEARAQAEATLQATLDKELTARTGRTDAGAKQLTDWYKEDFTQQRDVHKAAVDAFYKNQDTQQQLENQLKLKAAEGEQARLTNKDQAVNAANQNGLIAAQKEQSESRDKVAALDGFRAIADGVGQPGWLQTTKMPGSDKTIAEQLGQLGMPLSDTGGVQLLHGAMTNLTRELRTGLAMGTLSDRDLDFVARLGPTDWMDPDTRAAAVGYLQQAYRAKMRFASDLQKEMSRGKNYGDAFDAADAKQKPFVPSAPADLTANWNDNSDAWVKARTKWAQENDVRPGTLFHLSDGSIHVMKSPKRQGQP